MNFLEQILDPPSYGFVREGQFYKPSHREIWAEFFRRINIFSTRKNWLSLYGWVVSLSFAVPLYFFITRHFSLGLALAGFVYSMVILGSHGTFWLHRYCAHRAYQYRNPFVRMICRNLVIKIIPEETYAVSHFVHHYLSEKPGDPYNVYGGWLYCFLADVNHQSIRRDFSEKEYTQLCKMFQHSGVKINSYAQYQKWGTLCHPLYTILHYALNWTFWYGTFYFLGGNALATALFGCSGVWAVGIRTFNYDGHGRGKDRRREGVDFNRADISINQNWAGYVAGEWHNNHHLFPHAARSGFQPYQLDLPWLLIRFLHRVGGIASYRDGLQPFMENYYLPYLAAKKKQAEAAVGAQVPDPSPN